MPKYRLLSKEELEPLEKEFVDYLVVNGITADEWVRMKEEDIDKAEQIIALFSDVVFEGILRKVAFLEYRAKNEIRAFQCLQDKIILVGMRAPLEAEVDFNDPAFLQNASTGVSADLEIYMTEKTYADSREQELFRMTEQGYQISDGHLFKTLMLAWAQNKG